MEASIPWRPKGHGGWSKRIFTKRHAARGNLLPSLPLSSLKRFINIGKFSFVACIYVSRIHPPCS